MDLRPTDIEPPLPPTYSDWWIEIPCDRIFGEGQWDEGTIAAFVPQQHVTPPPNGWSITGHEFYAHKDAAGTITLYLAPPPATLALREKAARISRDLTGWIDLLDEWRASLAADLEDPAPYRWHLTDLRHLHNLGSARWQGYLPKEGPTPTDPRTHAIIELEGDIHDWLDDHFGDADENTT